MLGNPKRGIMFNSPTSTSTYRVQCSFCDHRSWAKPDRIKPEDMPKWKSHTCSPWSCNGFTCLVRYVESGGNEFFVANNKYLMCYKCKKLDGSQIYQLRPFDKLPANAEIYLRSSDSTTSKTTEEYKSYYPSQFESN